MGHVTSENIGKSTLWSIFQRYLPSVLQIISTLVITRMISPDNYGEVALVTTFCQISILLVSSGLGDGLIYRVNNSQIMYSSVFWLNTIIAIGIYTILFLLSEIIATFYHIGRIAILIRVISANIILYALSYIQRVRFQQKIDFYKLAIISMIASVLGCNVGIWMAYNGYDIWSIIFQTLIINGIELLLLWIVSDWYPSLLFSFSEIKIILPYSLRVLMYNLTEILYTNIYSLVLGKVFNTKSLGYFNRMQTVAYFTTTNFMFSLESVFFPVLCKKKESPDEIKYAYEKILRLSTFMVFPILVFLIVLARAIILLVLTAKWVDGTNVLQLVCFAYLFVPIIYTNNSFLKITNNPDILFKSNCAKKIVGLIVLIITFHYSFEIVCYGFVVYYMVDCLISMLCIHKFVGITMYSQLSFLLNNVFANILLSGALIAIVACVDNELLMIIASFVCVALYFIAAFLLKSTEGSLVANVIMKIKE